MASRLVLLSGNTMLPAKTAESFLQGYSPDVIVAALQVIAINRVAAALEEQNERAKYALDHSIHNDAPGLTRSHKCNCKR